MRKRLPLKTYSQQPNNPTQYSEQLNVIKNLDLNVVQCA